MEHKTVITLRKELRRKGLSATGKKADLIKRLKEAEALSAGRASYTQRSIRELQTELSQRRLSTSGTKDELVKRLEEDDEALREARLGVTLTGLRDADKRILLLLHPKDLSTACQLSGHTAELCRDDLFWRDKLINDYGINLSGYLRFGATFKKVYKLIISLGYGSPKLLQEAVIRGYLPLASALLEFGDAYAGEEESVAWEAHDLDNAMIYAINFNHPAIFEILYDYTKKIYPDHFSKWANGDLVLNTAICSPNEGILDIIINKGIRISNIYRRASRLPK